MSVSLYPVLLGGEWTHLSECILSYSVVSGHVCQSVSRLTLW